MEEKRNTRVNGPLMRRASDKLRRNPRQDRAWYNLGLLCAQTNRAPEAITSLQRAEEIDFAWLEGVTTLGLTAGASAPEILVREVVDRIAERFAVTEEQVETAQENISFKLPRGLEVA